MLKITEFFIYWFVGIKTISIAGLMTIYYFIPEELRVYFHDSFGWEFMYRLIIILLVCLGFMYLSTPLSKRIELWSKKKHA